MSIGIKPLGTKVIIKQVEVAKKTSSGILLAGTDEKPPQIAEIVAVGPGTADEPMTLNVGDKVIFVEYAGTPFKHDGVEYQILNQREILAIFE